MNSKNAKNGKAEQEVIPFYGMRSRSLTWRSQWWRLSRSDNERALTKARDHAYQHKLRLIGKEAQVSGALAGYDPAGAGSPWYPLGTRNVNGRVKALAVHPTDPDTVYAGAASGGVWKSIDGGQTWDSLWDMQESIAIGALGISTSAPDTIYAGTGEWAPGWGPIYGGAGVYVSTDGGVNWSKRASVGSRWIGKLVVDPTDSQRLWVCGDQGLERSTDGGVNWTSLRIGTITDIVLDPTNPDIVLIAVRFDGFYRSTDGGSTFTLLPGGPTGVGVEWPQIAIGKSGAHANNFLVIKMGGTVQRSINGGTTFSAVPGSHGGFFAGWCDVIACAPDDEQIIFWGGVGLERTANGGTSWTSLPVHADQHAVVFAPSNTNVVYMANDGGMWRSDNKGASVRKVSNGLVITQFYNINFWRTLSNVVGGGAQDNQTNYTTSGFTWKPVNGGDGGWFLIDPIDPRVMYAESQYANISKSTDGGQTWTSKTAGITGTTPWEGVMTMDPDDHLRLFYGTDHVLRSTDGLATAWTDSSQVLIGEVSSIAVAPSDSNRVYAGTGFGKLYRSDDGGNTAPWADKSGTLPGRVITSIEISATDPNTLLVSIGGLSTVASSQSVYRSTNGGTTWNDVSGDLPQVVGNGVVIDPSNVNMWYLATDTGVYRTQNGGTNWLPFDNGIPNVPVSGLVVDVASKILYCGTMGRGAYKLDITPGVVKEQVDVYFRDDDLDTGERFPSPSGLPDPLQPAPDMANAWESPDIKVNHKPFFTTTGVFDGVDFDLTLNHQDPIRGQQNRFYVQVHNRGWKTTHNVRIRAFVADATTGLKNLPNALVAPDFDLVSTTDWQPVGPAKTITDLIPNRPVIVSWDYTLPVSTATHTCCLAVVSSPDDPFNNTETDTWQLLTKDKRVCLLNLHVVDPGPSPMAPILTTMDFHNPSTEKALIDIVVRPNRFSRGTIGLLLPTLKFAHPNEALRDVGRVPLGKDDPIGHWYTHGNKRLENRLAKRLAACDRTQLYEFDPTKPSELRGIVLDAGETLRGVFVSRLKRDIAQAGLPRFDVVQRLGGTLVGGSTFQFGYDVPTDPLAKPNRVRILASRLRWRDDQDRGRSSIVFAEVSIDDDKDRTYQKFLGDLKGADHERCIFDGIVMEGQALTLSLIEVDNGLAHSEQLYRRRFDGAVTSWLGKHDYSGRGADRRQFSYEIIQVLPTTVSAAD